MKTNHEIVTIIEAYNNLSQEAFAVWIRLHVTEDQQLCEGRVKLARTLGYSEARSNEILRELSLAGYVECIPGPRIATPTTVRVRRRCKISGKNRFVRLRRGLSGHAHDLIIKNDSLASEFASMTAGLGRFAQSAESDTDEYGSGTDGSDSLKSSIECRRTRAMVKKQPNKKVPKEGSGSGVERPKRIKFLTLDGGIEPDQKSSHERKSIEHYIPKSGIDLSKFSPKERRAKRVLRKQKTIKRPATGKPINWSRMDQTGKPQITFSPGESERARMVAVLTTDPRKLCGPERKLKKAMEGKLKTEFTRIYERYRKDVQRQFGRTSVSYGVMPAEAKYALRAAVSCIVKGVTPRQVLEYWHANIGDFVNANMSVPPLTFLAQPAMIDTVVIAGMAEKHDIGAGTKRKRRSGRSMHTMSDTSLLHRGLRRALMEQGFDLSKLNDRYLATIQAYAVDVASGATDPGVIPSKLRDMVQWAADNVFHDVDPEDYI